MRDYTSIILDEANYGGLPVAYYPLDEANGTVARDLMVEARGSGYNATYTGGYTLGVTPGPVNGERRGCVRFNGSTGRAVVNASVLGNSPSAFSLMGWVRASAQNSAQVISISNSGDNAPMIQLASGTASAGQSTAGLRPYIRWSNNVVVIGNDPSDAVGTAFDGTWHHVAMTYDAGDLRAYIDGVVVLSRTIATGALTVNRTTIGALTRVSVSDYLDGEEARVSAWRYALSADRVMHHHLAGRNGPPPRGILL